jgi:general secretion pathway protein E
VGRAQGQDASYRIDPLKIDLRAVTQVMSSDYAQRRGILPVEVNGKDVTIATSEPFVTAGSASSRRCCG